MATDSTTVAGLSDSLPLHERIAAYRGNPYLVLLALLRDPDAEIAPICRKLPSPVNAQAFYDWRNKLPGYADIVDEIRDAAHSIRSDYAKAALEEAVPSVVDTMVARASTIGARDSQRAGERLLEATGILPKPGLDTPTPIQVTTHTYVLVQPGAEPVVVEQLVQRKAIEAPKLNST